jgi:hypothetical protein
VAGCAAICRKASSSTSFSVGGRIWSIPQYAPTAGSIKLDSAATTKLAGYLAIATLVCAILGAAPSSSVLCAMVLADYLRDQAVMYRQLAERSDDPVVKNEMLELASICEEVANNIEDHLTGG